MGKVIASITRLTNEPSQTRPVKGCPRGEFTDLSYISTGR